MALGEIRSDAAVPALSKALSDKDAEVRRQVVFALGELRAKSAVDALGAAIKDADGEVRKQACFALGEIGDARAVPALTAALADSEAEVREQAVFALGELHAEEAAGPWRRRSRMPSRTCASRPPSRSARSARSRPCPP